MPGTPVTFRSPPGGGNVSLSDAVDCGGAAGTTTWTVRGVVPDDDPNVSSPVYDVLTVSTPTGAAVELQLATPETSGAVQSGNPLPVVKATVPAGVPSGGGTIGGEVTGAPEGTVGE